MKNLNTFGKATTVVIATCIITTIAFEVLFVFGYTQSWLISVPFGVLCMWLFMTFAFSLCYVNKELE